MRQCYHQKCDKYKEERINWKFIRHTYQALIDSVVQLSDSTCSSSNRKYEQLPNSDNSEMFIFETFKDPLLASSVSEEISSTEAISVEIIDENIVDDSEEVLEVETEKSSSTKENKTDHHSVLLPQTLPVFHYYPHHHHQLPPLIPTYPIMIPQYQRLYHPVLFRHFYCYPYC